MAAAATTHTLDTRPAKPVSARITASDLIVIAGAIAAILIGWAIKGWHDNRLVSASAAGVTIHYPRGWIQLPPVAPQQFVAISNTNGRMSATLTEQNTQQTDITKTLAAGIANPASGQTGYTQLSNEQTTVDGNKAVRADYAYVKTTIGGSTVPVVMRGRQAAWIKNGKLFVFAVEAPSDDWGRVTSEFGRLVDKIGT